MLKPSPWLMVIVSGVLCSCAAQPATPQEAPTHRFEEVAPGVYFATATGQVMLMSNAMVVVNESDVLVVDSHVTADAARELLKSVKSLTDKPVRFLVNSHFHFDHAHGNQAFPDEVEIIGHEYTRQRLLGDITKEPTYSVMGSPEVVAGMVAELEKQVAVVDNPMRPTLEAQLAMLKRHLRAVGDFDPTPPNTTLERRLTLFRGDREIQIVHLGRGHTGGDVVVFLPRERILFTGDLFYDGAPYLGDAYPEDFVQTLEAMKTLEFDLVVPGHGPLVRDRSRIEFTQEYLTRYWRQVKSSFDQGRTVEEAAGMLDLSGYERYASFQLSRPEILELEIRRMYYLLGRKE